MSRRITMVAMTLPINFGLLPSFYPKSSSLDIAVVCELVKSLSLDVTFFENPMEDDPI